MRMLPLLCALALACADDPPPQGPPPVPAVSDTGGASSTDTAAPRVDGEARCPQPDGAWLDSGLPEPVPPRDTAALGTDDFDGDGFPADVDCDDRDALVHPGAPERCDGADSDCDAATGEEGLVTLDLRATFTSVQEAVAAASDGDVIYVCPGEYDENLRIGKDVAIVTPTGADPSTTVIDALDRRRPVVVADGAHVLVEGLELRGAVEAAGEGDTADTGDTGRHGGGLSVACATVVVRGARITGNTARTGGGIFARDAHVYLQASEVVTNLAHEDGGGVHVGKRAHLAATGSVIADNVAGGDGGGLRVDPDASAVLESTTLSGNAAYGGGGISSAGALEGTDVHVEGNAASSGGGAYLTGVGFAPVRWSFLGNSAEEWGGGLFVGEDADVVADAGTLVEANVAAFGGGLRTSGGDWDGGTFRANVATEGGAVYQSYGDVALRATFVENVAERGGALALMGGGTELLPGTTLHANSAVEGGAVYLGWYGPYAGSLHADGVDFGEGALDNLPADNFAADLGASFTWGGAASTWCAPWACDMDPLPPGILATSWSSVDDSVYFGDTVAIDGDHLAVSSNPDGVHLYERSAGGWTEVALLPSIGGTLPLAIDGDTLVYGQPRDPGGEVHVYVWDGVTWTHEATLSKPASRDFGGAVDLQGDRLVVGAPDEGVRHGAVYVFERTGGVWTQTARFRNPAERVDDQLGGSVALDGDTIAAGAGGDDEDLGRVDVLVLDQGVWTLAAELRSAVPIEEGSFGATVDLDGDTIAVAADGLAQVFVGAGATWTAQATLEGDGDVLTRAIALEGDRVVVGASEADGVGLESGRVYLFERSAGNWGPPLRWVHEAPFAWADTFGGAVALSGDTIVVGARDTSGESLYRGAVHVFTPDPVAPAW